MYTTAMRTAAVQISPQPCQFNPVKCKSSPTQASSARIPHGQGANLRVLESHSLGLHADNQMNGNVCTTSGVVCRATNAAKDKATFSRDELTDSQRQQWEESSGLLEGLGFSVEEADKMLGKAFGWVRSPYWSESHEQTVPELSTVSSKVDFVKALGLSDVELTPVLKKFPELLDCRQTLMEHNLGILDKEWGISGKSLKSLLKRNPHVLGYSVDCRGDCMAQCTRCWVRF